VRRKTAITNHELQVALVFGVYHRLFPNFKASVLTVATALKQPGSVAEVLIQLPTDNESIHSPQV
jgi:hypothetical protein